MSSDFKLTKEEWERATVPMLKTLVEKAHVALQAAEDRRDPRYFDIRDLQTEAIIELRWREVRGRK